MADAVDRLTAALSDRYRIERELGEGGMATVYLAEDLKHNRKVAIKVLKPELAAVLGADRFLQEIATTAQLQHPNILPLFDSGTAEGFLYYVMPYVEGETLRRRLDRETQLGVDESVKLVSEVADALQYAHEQGVVHRDIKPENLLLHAGRPMVADFGIALAVSAAAGGRMTETGLSLGTPHYMSPEQATAEKVITARSDIYSLGSVLYEMLTGQPPHLGGSAQQIIVKIIADPARPVAELRKSVPVNVAAAVAKALEKLPADRFESAKAFADALGEPGFRYGEGGVTPAAAAAPPNARRDWRLPVAVVVAVAFAGLAVLQTVRASRGTPPSPVGRFNVSLPADLTSASAGIGEGSEVAVSPDGSLIVVAASDAHGSRLYVRRLGELTIDSLPGTEGATQPFFSPDGKWIGFIADGSIIRKVPVSGGPAKDVWRNPETGVVDPDWGDDGNIFFTRTGSLFRVSSDGGAPDTLMTAQQGRINWAHVLPGSRSVLVTVRPPSRGEQVALLDLATKKLSTLVRDGAQALYLPTGYLLYGNPPSQSLLAVPFDASTGKLTGEPTAVLENILFADAGSNGGGMQLAISGAGTLVYLSSQTQSVGGTEIVLTDLHGHEDTLPPDMTPPVRGQPRFAPVGNRMAFNAGSDIYVYEPDAAGSSRLTFEGQNFYPTWSPDGSEIAFTSKRPGSQDFDVYRRRSDGRGSAKRLTNLPQPQGPRIWLKDGRLLVVAVSARTGYDLDVLDTTGTLTPYLANPWNESSPVLSPDARWVAYVSDESGPDEVYVSAFPKAGGRWKVSEDGGSDPYWDDDGTIYYLYDEDLWAARVRTSPSVVVQDRRMVLAGPFVSGGRATNMDREPHGGRFALVRAPTNDIPTQLTVVTNWLDELKAHLGGGG